MSSLTVYFKRFDSTLPIPEYKSSGAAAFDLYARQTVTIEPLNIGYIPLNIALQLPDDHWALVSARSSLHKRGLFLANGIGVGDHDFCGPDDEYKAPVFNFTNQFVNFVSFIFIRIRRSAHLKNGRHDIRNMNKIFVPGSWVAHFTWHFNYQGCPYSSFGGKRFKISEWR